MPKYRIELQDGRVFDVEVEGEEPPTEAEIMAQLGAQEAPAEQPPPTSGSLATPGVIAARAALPGVMRMGEEIATSPIVGKAARTIASPMARAATQALGATGGVAGWAAGAAATSPAVVRGAEAATRGTGALAARAAGSGLARWATGLPGVLLSMVTNPGDRPVGETAESTAERQARFEREYAEILARRGR